MQERINQICRELRESPIKYLTVSLKDPDADKRWS